MSTYVTRGTRWSPLVAVVLCVCASTAGALSLTRPAALASERGVVEAGIRLAAAPPVVQRFCRERAHRHKFLVLCPTRWPHAATSSVTGSGSSVLGPSFYWGSFNDQTGFDAGDDGHLVFGGQRPTFSLVGACTQTWPRPGQPQPIRQLALPRFIAMPRQGGGRYVVQRPARIFRIATVGRSRALVLVAPDYPTGGFNGGHVLVVWNREGHGYFVSVHYEGSRSGAVYSRGQRVTAALAIARSARPSDG